VEEENEALRRQLDDLRRERADLEARTKTTLSPVHFIALLTFVPICWMFVALGGIIVWKTTANPAEVAPHLDIILVAFAIFSGPVIAGVSDLMKMVAGERGSKRKDKPDEDA